MRDASDAGLSPAAAAATTAAAGRDAASAATPAVGLHARGWGWRHSGRQAWALRGVDLDVRPGERVLLLGPSGAGKSTLLAAAAGLLDDGAGESEGALEVDGLDARTARSAATLPGVSRTGLLLQDPDAQTVLARCGDDVAFGLENHGLPTELIWPRVDEALRLVGFPYGRERATAALSGGERQRLALAGVAAMRPGLLMLDEPTAMIDPDGARMLVRSVSRVLGGDGIDGDGFGAGGLGAGGLGAGGLGGDGPVGGAGGGADGGLASATLIVVEHRVEQWLGLVTRIVVLEPGGGVIADGPALEVLAEQGPALFEHGVWVPRRFRGPISGWPSRLAGGLSSEQEAVLATATADARTTTPRGEVLLRTRDLAVRRARLAPVLTGVDLEVRAGEVLFLTGPNGAGKSTLALALSGLTAPAAGEVVALPALADGVGEQPVRWRPRDLVTRIGTVFQEPQHQFVAATVDAEIAVGPRRAGVSAEETADRTSDVLSRLRLRALGLANPFTLSGGEQRRLSVATALVTRPAVLVLDEPTFGQDSRTWAELVDLLRELLDQGTAVVCATHDRDLVDTFVGEGCGRVLVVAGGTAVEESEPDPVRAVTP